MPTFLQTSKIDYAYKFGLGVLGTNTTWSWFAELYKNESNILASRIWADDIPFAANFAEADSNATTSSVVTKRTVTLTLQPSHNNHLWRARTIAGDASSDVILDAISPLDVPDASGAPSQGYTVRLYRDNGSGGLGTEILTTDGAWAWHYKLCALMLDDGHTATNEGWSVPLHVVFYQYTGSFGASGSGSSAVNWADIIDKPAELDLTSDQTVSSYVAAENIGGQRLVALGSSSSIVYANSSDLTQSNSVLGMTRNSVTTGNAVDVICSGHITEPSWSWDILTPVYLGLNGLPTQVAPTSGFCQIVGMAETPTTLHIRLTRPIVLG